MPIAWEDSPEALALYYEDSDPALAAYWENLHDPVWAHPDAPSISGWGITSGTGKSLNLDVPIGSLPVDVTMSATLEDAESWSITRITGPGESSVAAESPDNSIPPFWQEALRSDFRPNRNVWDYSLAALRTVGGVQYSAHAIAHLRVVEPPRLDSLVADGPYETGGQATFTQNYFVSWSGDAGWPEAAGSMTQSGFHVAHLPTARHLAMADGARTGNQRTRITTTQRPGASTTLTLRYDNAAGSAQRDVTLHWRS